MKNTIEYAGGYDATKHNSFCILREVFESDNILEFSQIPSDEKGRKFLEVQHAQFPLFAVQVANRVVESRNVKIIPSTGAFRKNSPQGNASLREQAINLGLIPAL